MPNPRDSSQRHEAPPHGRPSATPTASNTDSQEHELWGRWRASTAASCAPNGKRQRAPLHAQRTSGRGRGGCPTLDTSYGGTSPPPPPRAHSCQLHNAQHNVARARSVGLLGGSHTRTSCAKGKRAVGPGCTPEGQAVGGGRVPNPTRPFQTHEVPPPHEALLPPRGCTQARKSASRMVSDASPHPQPPRPKYKGSGPRLPAQKDKQPEESELVSPDAPHHGERSPPLGNHLPPPRRTMSRGVCKPRGQWRVPTPAHLHPEPVGSGPRLRAQRIGSPRRVRAYP